MVKNKRIVFISDLHFDINSKEIEAESRGIKDSERFLDFVKINFSNDILLIAGDMFSSYKKTLEFVQKAEKKKITGFFVLGNHDFEPTNENDTLLKHSVPLSINNVITLFDEETEKNKYFKFLYTGKKVDIDDFIFIGDTGWLSFERTDKEKNIIRIDPQKTFKNFKISSLGLIADFSWEDIRRKHEKWINFANKIIRENPEKIVVILTHFPMFDETKGNRDCFWSSKTNLKESKNVSRIFGHTHSNFGSAIYKENDSSAQIGYSGIDPCDLKRFGVLILEK